jgi:site-specific DNA recombinase
MGNSSVAISLAEHASIIAAIYARTSSPNQRFNYSIEEQVNECWEYCEERKWAVKYVFVDESQRAKTTERPKFQLMLEKARAREFQVIVFWKLDRFCRSLRDLVNLERNLGQWGVKLCSVTEFIDTSSPVGRFNYRNLASVAELESEIIGERSRLGLYGLAREHKWPGAHTPVGYDKDREGRLIPNGSEAQLVRRIFDMYLAERSMPEVAFKLNAEGLRTRKNREWNARAVRDVLTNGIYVGDYSVAGVEDEVEQYRIIPKDLFRKADEIMLRYKTSHAERPPMPETRRMTKIGAVFTRYLELLQQLGPDGPSSRMGEQL